MRSTKLAIHGGGAPFRAASTRRKVLRADVADAARRHDDIDIGEQLRRGGIEIFALEIFRDAVIDEADGAGIADRVRRHVLPDDGGVGEFRPGSEILPVERDEAAGGQIAHLGTGVALRQAAKIERQADQRGVDAVGAAEVENFLRPAGGDAATCNQRAEDILREFGNDIVEAEEDAEIFAGVGSRINLVKISLDRRKTLETLLVDLHGRLL